MKFVSKVMTFDASSVGTDYVVANAYGSTYNRYCNPIMTDLFCGKLVEFLTSMGVDVSYDSEKKYTYINGVPFLIVAYNKLNYTGTSAGANASPKRSMYKITVESPYSRICMLTNSATWPNTSALYSYNDCGSILFDEETKIATVKFKFCGTSEIFYFAIGSAAILRRTQASTSSNYWYITETTTDALYNNYYCGTFFFLSGKDCLTNKPIIAYGAQLNSFSKDNYFFIIEKDDEGVLFEPVPAAVKTESTSSYYTITTDREGGRYFVRLILQDAFVVDLYRQPSQNHAGFPGINNLWADVATIFTSNGRTFWGFPYLNYWVDITED
ncbi:MAG: hypothetical protein HFH88_13410 [Lachnospiraceae bacterium]|nr:hypothetical protein [Lachnospiraceae bacterium]